MQFSILGPVAAYNSERPVPIGGLRVRALLGLLALEPGRTIPVDRLVDALWGDEPPAKPRNALATVAKRLRAALGETGLVAGGAVGYALAAPPEAVDAERFARLAERGTAALSSGDPETAASLLAEALALWQGPEALADLIQVAPYAAPAAARLAELRLRAVEDLAAAHLAAGRFAQALDALAADRAAHPLRESLAALAVRALAGAGRQSDALAQYELTRALLADELGIDPSPELSAAHLAVLRGELPPQAAPARLTAVSTAVSTAAPTPASEPATHNLPTHNLPTPRTGFIGREDELAELTAMLATGRLVCLVGPGGAGKTRIAVECAARAKESAVRMAELAAVTDPDQVPYAVLAALDVRDTVLQRDDGAAADPLDRLVTALTGRPLLLVLDNCEQVIEAVAELVDQALARCPQLRVLATSREPLGIPGEQLCPVPPLGLPGPGDGWQRIAEAPAVRLFAQRAAAVRPGFTVDEDNAAAVGAICTRLDGMPLAIELAAAKARMLTPRQLADRLDDRFRLLTGGSRTALPRQQTLRAVVAWSWDLLTEDEARAARRFSVFAGSATLEDAERVCGADALDALLSLTGKSILTAGDDGRLRMLETIRAYAAERLAEAGEAAEWRLRHARCFTELAETAEPLLRTRAQLAWIDRLVTEHDNCLTALRGALELAETALALRLCAALGWLWWLRGQRGEAAHWAGLVLAAAGPVPPAGAVRAHAACLLVSRIGDFAHPTDFTAVAGEWPAEFAAGFEELTERLAAEGPVHPLLLISGASLTAVAGRTERAVQLLDGYAESTDPWLAATARLVRGSLRMHERRPDLADPDLEAAADAFRRLGERWGLSQALMLLIRHRVLRGGGLAAAGALMTEADGLIADWLGADEIVATLLRHAYLRLREDDPDGAAADVARAAGAASGAGAGAALQVGLARAAVDARRGDFEAALPAFERGLAELEAQGANPYDTAFFRINHGRALSAHGDHAAAVERFRTALRSMERVPYTPLRIMALLGFAATAVSAGEYETAAVVYGGCAAVFGVGQGSPDSVRARERARAALGPAAYEAAFARGGSLDLGQLLEFVASAGF
ncbi:AfsR/SARP family transcriptional regulator [Streptomyces orinoci]|uniref:BTAD domain-containing putative transcriptional regulator n=1 Tax=Streptomyces orinoci TaxID=67339 RepID=A0ABV3JTQ1_STRON|nr:BTAD domain-containing putative transcriptional regulator [Streptomyces orinoci]